MSYHYVYILQCRSNNTYIGCTSNLKDRIKRHKKGYVPATKDRLPVRLICYFALKDKNVAYKLEKYFKSGSGRAFVKKHFM